MPRPRSPVATARRSPRAGFSRRRPPAALYRGEDLPPEHDVPDDLHIVIVRICKGQLLSRIQIRLPSGPESRLRCLFGGTPCGPRSQRAGCLLPGQARGAVPARRPLRQGGAPRLPVRLFAEVKRKSFPRCLTWHRRDLPPGSDFLAATRGVAPAASPPPREPLYIRG